MFCVYNCVVKRVTSSFYFKLFAGILEVKYVLMHRAKSFWAKVGVKFDKKYGENPQKNFLILFS